MGMIGNTPYQGIIQTGNMQDAAVTAQKLAAAAIADKLGYTPAAGNGNYQVLSFDTIKQPGLYQYDGAFTGTKPPDNQGNYRTIEFGDNGRYTQIAFPWNSDKVYLRRKVDASWTNWAEISPSSASIVAALGYTPPNLSYVSTVQLTGGFTNGTWYQLWNNSSLTSSGMYIIDFYASTQNAGGNMYSISGVTPPFHFYAGGTNSGDVVNIPVHQIGHALGGNSIALRTRTNYTPGSCVIEMQYNGASLSGMNSTGGREGYFYIRKLI